MNKKKQQNFIDNFFDIFEIYPREYFVAGFFILFFFLIIWNVFAYTVVDYDFYEELAYNQQVWEVKIPVTRGTIYSNTGSGTVLGTSVDLNDLAVDPQIEWDKAKLTLFLRDIVFKQLCYLKPEEDCYNGMLKFLRVLKIEDFENTEAFTKKLILERLKTRLAKTKVTSVLLGSGYDNEKQTALSALWLSGIYVNEGALYINPEEIQNIELLALKVSEITWLSVESIQTSARKRDLRYIPIINKISISVSDEIKQYIEDENQAIKQWILEKENSIGWFMILTANPHRLYPEWELAAQIIWFLDNQWGWQYGIEWHFNELLKWYDWQIVSKKDIKWRIIDPISLNSDDLLWQWVDIYTTIDRNVQKRVEDILEAGVKRYNAIKWSIVVMEPNTWEVVAMANYPTFNLNSIGDTYDLEKVNYAQYPNPAIDLLGKTILVEDSEQWDKYYYDSKEIFLREAKREELWDFALVKYKYKNDFGAWVYRNDAISSLYEPGSIMKAITVAIGIDTWEINRYDMYQDNGSLKIDNFTISNDSSACLGYNSFGHALNYSCNVWMIRIAQRIWKAIFHQYLYDFWFSWTTWISLQWEAKSKIDPYEKWSRAKLFTSSYGLGISVTPLQMASAYSAIANGWVFVKPRVIKEVQFSNGKVIEHKQEVTHRVLKPSTSKIVTAMLVDGVDKWVAKNGRVEWYSVAGKTWTSQIAYRWKYERGPWSTTWSFVWFGPAEDPKFVVVVKLDRPKVSNYGWQTSAYLFWEVTKYLFDYYRIPKKTSVVSQ